MGRRVNGEGSIHQRKSDGRWCASLSLGNGKRRHFLGHSWAEVHERLVAAQNARQEGLPLVTEKQTVRQFLTHWLDTSESSRKARTNVRYRELLRLHVIPHVGDVQLSKLMPQQVQGLYRELEKKGLAASTVRQVHAVLHKAFKQAVGWNLMHRNPTEHTERPRVERKEMAVLSPDQARKLLDAARGSRYEALFTLAVTTGMRQGELLGLRWSAVDLEKGVVQVQFAMQRIAGRFEFVEPKSSKSRRTIAVGATAVEALKRHRVRQNEERLGMGAQWEDWDLVFCNELGKPVEASNLTHRHFRPLLVHAALPKIRFHDLRHTAATIMLGAHVDVKVVSEVLGHSQTAFTMDRYQHVNLAMQRQASDAVEALLV